MGGCAKILNLRACGRVPGAAARGMPGCGRGSAARRCVWVGRQRELVMTLRLVGWIGLLELPLALYLAQNYGATDLNLPWFVPSTFYLAAVGHFFVLSALVALILIAPLCVWWRQWSKVRLSYALIILVLFNGLLAIDAQVYALNHFHFTPTVFELFVHRGEPLSTLSLDLWLSILWRLVVLVLYSAAVLLISWQLARRKVRCRLLTGLCVLMWVMANLIHAYADFKQIAPLVEIAQRLPWYHPLTMNTFLQDHGLMQARPEQITQKQMAQSSQRPLNYPKQPLTYFAHVREPYNIVLITVPSLRADMLAPETMPLTYAWSQEALVYERNFAASNSTRGTFFSLLYGLTPSYWPHVAASAQEAALAQALQAKDYEQRLFISFDYESLGLKRAFGPTGQFYPVDLNASALERDHAVIAGWSDFVASHDPRRKFFAWVALDGLRTYVTSPQVAQPFSPANTSLNKLALGPKTDPTPVFNLYRNAVYYADTLVNQVLAALSASGLAEQTIVILTSDHGEEFNDNGANYWGHNSNFSRVQMQVPLVIKWPQKAAQRVDAVTVSYDLTATLLPQVLGVQNRGSDYSLGRNLLLPVTKPRKFLLVGSYLEQALLEKDRIIVLDAQGRLTYRDWNYQPVAAGDPEANLFAAIRQMTAFLQDAQEAELSETSALIQARFSEERAVPEPAAAENTEAAEDMATGHTEAAEPTAGQDAPAEQVGAAAAAAPRAAEAEEIGQLR